MPDTERRSGLRVIIGGFMGRFVRRGFFRLVFLLFLLCAVLPFALLQAVANRSSANALLEQVTGQVFDRNVADVTWDEEKTLVRGPDLALRGTIDFYDLKVTRRAGATQHDAREPLQYDFITIPRVTISYDLKRLPALPVTGVDVSGGLTVYFNIYKGTWIDQDLFKPGEGEAATPELPEINLGDEARLMVRADGILVPPEDLDKGTDWYDFVLKKLSLLADRSAPDRYRISGSVHNRRFQAFNLGGFVDRQGRQTEIEFRTAEPIHFNREYAAVLAEDVRDTVDQFSIDAPNTTLKGTLRIVPGKDLQFDAMVYARDGRVCFVGFPLVVEDVSADIEIRNNNIVVNAIGRRNGAEVQVDVDVDRIGEATELLDVSVRIRDLLVDEAFRLALLNTRLQPDNQNYNTGAPFDEEGWTDEDSAAIVEKRGTRGYPEWPGPAPWEGGRVYPDLDPVFPFISRAFAPMGIVDFELSFLGEVKGINPTTRERRREDTLNFKVFVRDTTACFVGLPEQGGGFPVPLNNVYGVIEGQKSAQQPGRYTIRGYNADELAKTFPDADPTRGTETRRGLTGTLTTSGERVFINAVFQDGNPEPVLTLAIQTEGVDFSRAILARMPEGVRSKVEPFNPSGKVDIDNARLVIKPRGDTEIVYEFSLLAKSVAAQYLFPGAAEPARFREVRGTLSIESVGNVVRLERVEGKLIQADSPFLVSLTYRNDTVQSFTVESNEFAVSPALKSIVPPGIGTALERFNPAGMVKIRANTVDSAGLSNIETEILFLGGPQTAGGGTSVLFDLFPYRLTNVTGQVFVAMRDDMVEAHIRRLSARGVGDAEVELDGRVLIPQQPEGAGAGEDAYPIVDVDVRATRIPIDAALLDALKPIFSQDLPEGQKSQMIQFVEDLHADGTFGVTGRYQIDDRGEMDWRFELALEGTGVRFEHFQLPIRDLYGTVIINKTPSGPEVSMRNVNGRIGGGEADTAEVFLHEVGYSEAAGWRIAASGRNLEFGSEAIRRALPSDSALKQMVLRIDPIGKFDIDLFLAGKDDFKEYRVSLDTRQTDVNLGLQFDDMTARFDVSGVMQGEEQRINGNVFVKEAFFKKARFNNITSNLQYFGDRLEFPNLRGYFYDGWLEGRFGTQGNDYQGDISIRAADLSKLGRTAFPDAGELIGALDAEVRFHSRPNDEGQIGRGRLDVQPFDRRSDDPARNTCKLAPVPLFDSIAAVTGSEANFDEAHVFFLLMETRIVIREMDIVSDSARVETFGGDDENWIMYGTAQMKMKMFFTLAPRTLLTLPGLQEVLDFFKQVLFPLYVTGTLNSPNVEPGSVSALELEAAQDEFPRRPGGG